MKEFILKLGAKLLLPFSMLENGNALIKLEVTLGMTFIFAPMCWLIEKLIALFGIYESVIYKDTEFMAILVLCLISDMILGVWKHWKLCTFDFKELYTGVATKTAVSFLGMVIFNAFASIMNVIPELYIGFMLIGKVANLVYVGGSALNSMYVITGGKFPPVAFMDRLKKFNTTLDVSVFKATKNEQTTVNNPHISSSDDHNHSDISNL